MKFINFTFVGFILLIALHYSNGFKSSLSQEDDNHNSELVEKRESVPDKSFEVSYGDENEKKKSEKKKKEKSKKKEKGFKKNKQPTTTTTTTTSTTTATESTSTTTTKEPKDKSNLRFYKNTVKTINGDMTSTSTTQEIASTTPSVMPPK